MIVKVRLFGDMRDYHPESKGSGQEVELTLGPNATVGAVIEKLRIPPTVPKTVLVNRINAGLCQTLKTGDVVSLLQPLSGG
jgi:molybdopterin converting factor small subunit